MASERINFSLNVANYNKLDALTDFACTTLGVSKMTLRSENRDRKHCDVRMAIYYIAHKHFKFTLEAIGYYFSGRNHTTVLHGLTQREGLIKTCDDYKQIERVLTDYVSTLPVEKPKYNTAFKPNAWPMMALN